MFGSQFVCRLRFRPTGLIQSSRFRRQALLRRGRGEGFGLRPLPGSLHRLQLFGMLAPCRCSQRFLGSSLLKQAGAGLGFSDMAFLRLARKFHLASLALRRDGGELVCHCLAPTGVLQRSLFRSNSAGKRLAGLAFGKNPVLHFLQALALNFTACRFSRQRGVLLDGCLCRSLRLMAQQGMAMGLVFLLDPDSACLHGPLLLLGPCLGRRGRQLFKPGTVGSTPCRLRFGYPACGSNLSQLGFRFCLGFGRCRLFGIAPLGGLRSGQGQLFDFDTRAQLGFRGSFGFLSARRIPRRDFLGCDPFGLATAQDFLGGFAGLGGTGRLGLGLDATHFGFAGPIFFRSAGQQGGFRILFRLSGLGGFLRSGCLRICPHPRLLRRILFRRNTGCRSCGQRDVRLCPSFSRCQLLGMAALGGLRSGQGQLFDFDPRAQRGFRRSFGLLSDRRIPRRRFLDSNPFGLATAQSVCGRFAGLGGTGRLGLGLDATHRCFPGTVFFRPAREQGGLRLLFRLPGLGGLSRSGCLRVCPHPRRLGSLLFADAFPFGGKRGILLCTQLALGLCCGTGFRCLPLFGQTRVFGLARSPFPRGSGESQRGFFAPLGLLQCPGLGLDAQIRFFHCAALGGNANVVGIDTLYCVRFRRLSSRSRHGWLFRRELATLAFGLHQSGKKFAQASLRMGPADTGRKPQPTAGPPFAEGRISQWKPRKPC